MTTNILRSLVATLLVALTSTLSIATAQTGGGGGKVPVVVTDVTSLVTNTAEWSAALLDNRADYYEGSWDAYTKENGVLSQGRFTMKPFNGVFMITSFVVGYTNEVFIDPAKPMPGFPSLGTPCTFQMYVNGYANMPGGKSRSTRHGQFYSSNLQPGDPINISIRPNYMELMMSVGPLEGDFDNMEIQVGEFRGYYNSYLSEVLGQNVFSVWVDPLRVAVGTVQNWTVIDYSQSLVVAVGKVTIGHGLATGTDSGVSGIEVSNDGGVREIYLNGDGNLRHFPNQTYSSSLAGWVGPVQFFNIFVSSGDKLNIETGGGAAFKVSGFKDGILTDVTPTSSGGLSMDVYGLSGYTSYQVIVTRVTGTEKTFYLGCWKYNN